MTEATEPAGLVQRVVAWLRAGYPEGVPPQDYVAVLGILRRTLTPAEVDRVVTELIRHAENGDARDGGGVVTRADLDTSIRQVLLGPALEEDIVRVSGRLASAGWPLGLPEERLAANSTAVRTGLVGRVVGWLREGYPAGLPENDFVPLVALLRRRLSDEELTQVAERLAAEGVLSPNRVDVGTAIASITSELASDDDVERVRAYLAERGWPVDFSG